MWQSVSLTGLLCLLCAVVFVLARKEGQKSERLRQIKAELEKTEKERARADKIHVAVSNMSDADVAERLQKLSGK